MWHGQSPFTIAFQEKGQHWARLYCLSGKCFHFGYSKKHKYQLYFNIPDGRATDVYRDCLESIEGVDECVTASRYIDEVLRPDFPSIRDFVTGEDGVACYCIGDLCNSELGEPDVPGKSFSLFIGIVDGCKHGFKLAMLKLIRSIPMKCQ